MSTPAESPETGSPWCWVVKVELNPGPVTGTFRTMSRGRYSTVAKAKRMEQGMVRREPPGTAMSGKTDCVSIDRHKQT